ncbi:helix-turn-helix domain-containing protein [Collimonas silvisoli]|uniref:helix-turn-helix domain-containing protein n=1 Tax=Collimonas silvisoli TaxID=2825884 RepID=UPI001B8BF265|nr:helix-turn-helix domain-containing protein [Collimonas silvisoli]
MTQLKVLPILLPMVDSKESKGMPGKYPGFASRVQAAMKDHAITVTDIKAKLSISYEMARRYMHGQAMPRQDKIVLLAELLKSSPAKLQFGDSEIVAERKSNANKFVPPQGTGGKAMIDAGDLTKLIDLFAKSTPQGRSSILDMASRVEKIDIRRKNSTKDKPQ